MADLTEEATLKCLSWLRFHEFQGDLMVLVEAKSHEENQQPDANLSEWRAERLGMISVDNEKRVMRLLNGLSKEYLAKYPQTLQQDLEILEQDDKT